MPKIGNDWELGNRPIKKNKKNLTQEVAKRKTVVSLTYKPTTKPQTMNKIERIFDAVMHAVTLLAIAGGFYWIFIRFLITYLKTL